ncbi:MAG: protein kinase [Deltaproteobacteria bacterium]|nr:protein kinase [Deltaproteobacteria bacterium]
MERSSEPSAVGPRGVLTPGKSLSGRYELLGRLGLGGMAEVYLARAIGLDEFEKIVVVKRVLPAKRGDRHFAAMFRDEARVAATLEHPNIVQTHDIGVSGQECFFTMEYLHGEDLKAILSAARKANEKLPLELALQIAVGCAAGLHHAHDQTDYSGNPLHIVHRDVSPSNIIVTRQSGVKLIDFGIAKAASDKDHTGVGVLKGKVAYMSPEQCRGEVLDRRSDIFAMGIVMYEMIAMQRPFAGKSVLGTVEKILREQPVPLTQLRPDCPADLEHVVMRALDKDPERRYPTAFEMQEELERATRESLLLALPGALGRYLEHLFGAKPHPWRLNAAQPPPVPRWAWSDLDSTLTAPRQPERAVKHMVGADGRLHPVKAPAVAKVGAAASPYTLRTASPSAAFPQSTEPTMVPPSMVGVTPQGPTALDARGMETTTDPVPRASPSRRRGSSTWAAKHLMLGGLVGGLLAGGTLLAWPESLDQPSDSTEARKVALASETPATSMQRSPTAPTQAALTTDATALQPGPAAVGPTEGKTAHPLGASPPPVSTPETGASTPPNAGSPASSGRADRAARIAKAERLLTKARRKMIANPTQAHRDAKAAYKLHPTRKSLAVAGLAACRIPNRNKALWAYKRTRGKTRTDLQQMCANKGVHLP